MDLERIVSELKSERDRLNRAISALGGSGPVVSGKAAPKRRRRRLTAAGRKRLSESMKRRWAAARRSGTASLRTSASAAPKKKRGGLTTRRPKEAFRNDEEALGGAQKEGFLETPSDREASLAGSPEHGTAAPPNRDLGSFQPDPRATADVLSASLIFPRRRRRPSRMVTG